ncbi:S8 family peptidase [Streptomyces violaceusniger]|uniref:S8 family peptidase n=1 Tax=Streptomyces violaceusniger TaxID=68280 RepID=UPI0009C3398E|nr:S8 family serine peptidase [Streptomyces hygroscopicus]AQW49196.1 peptidase S8/S53 subtilisin kexin sedolisin [Streptomyces hygroscopicus]
MRRLRRFLAVVGAAGVMGAMAAPVASGRPSQAAAEAPPVRTQQHTVTLITGDTVSVTTGADGKYAVEVKRGAGRESVEFVANQKGKEISVVPVDALRLLSANKLDASLFNITQLVKQGYDDKKTGSIPVIATYRAKAAHPAPEGARKTLSLPSVDGAAFSARKADAAGFWADISHDKGLRKIWLDRKVKASLDVSVPQIGAPEMWKAGYDGKGVKVAVLDTGIDTTHPDVKDAIEDSKSFVPDQTVTDGHGHGTHVADTIAGGGAGSGGKYKGVAPGAKLLVGKVMNDAGEGYSSWIIEGMEWAASSGAKIISMSLGGPASGPSDPLSEAVDQLSASSGALFVIAAGNSGPFEGTVETPGIADSALTVGAVDKSDKWATFSSRGPRSGDYAVKPEITAPGVDITAARAAGTSMGTPVDDLYTTASGTSMATPHVAGAAAIVAEVHPDWTGSQLKEALASTAKTSAADGPFTQGDGRVDVPRAATQGVFGTPTLSYGQYAYDADQPDARTIRYTNATAKPVTLKLASSVGGDSLSLGSDTVTVPANGAVKVPVTVDPVKADKGRHAGFITATGDDGAGGAVKVTTAVAYEKGEKLYDLKVTLLDREGNQTPSALYTLQELGDASQNQFGYMRGSDSFQLPAGTYSLATWIPVLDSGRHETSTSIVGDPQIELTGDTSLTLDARKAVEIRPQTKEKDVESQGVTTSWHREREGGSSFGLTYIMGKWKKHIYAAPTEKVTDGLFEFYTRWRLEKTELTASVTSPERVALNPVYANTYTGWPVKIDGKHKVRLVSAGAGTPEDFEGLDVKGKAVLMGLAPDGWPQDAVANATKAGAAYAIVYRKTTAGQWITAVDSATIPVMSVPGEEGDRLLSLLTADGGKGKVTVELGGTAVSPFVYDVLLPEADAIGEDLTYPVDSRNTTKVTARYHGGVKGWIGAEATHTFRPYQLFSLESAYEVPLGTQRTEYYTADPGTRVWRTVKQDYDSGGGRQWSPLVTYRPGTKQTVDWLAPVIRPTTAAEFGVSQREGDELTLAIPEFADSGPGHYGSSGGVAQGFDTVKTNLYADGKPVGEAPYGSGTFQVPAGKAAYRLTIDARRKADWSAYSTRTSTRWDFASAHTARATALPLLSIDYDLGVDLLGQARAGRKFGFGVTPRQQEGADATKLTGAKAWASYDDGTTWKKVELTRSGTGYRATVGHPRLGATNGFVSLRLQAADADGNRIDQTVIRAYGLK